MRTHLQDREEYVTEEAGYEEYAPEEYAQEAEASEEQAYEGDPYAVSVPWLWTLVVVLGCLGIVGLRALEVHPFLTDDALISLRYVERFLAGDGLTWNNGERVEGSSNLLWLLGVSGLGWLGIDLVAAIRLLGIFCTLGTLWFLARLVRLDRRTWPAVAAGPLLYAMAAPTATWAIGGMEAPLVAMLLAWAAVHLRDAFTHWLGRPMRHLLKASVPLALLCMTRPDGPLFAGIVTVAVALRGARTLGGPSAGNAGAAVLGLPALALIGMITFRLFYYGDWLPNTAYVKVRFGADIIQSGFQYVVDGLWSVRGVFVPALLGLLFALRSRAVLVWAVTLVVMALAWLLYQASIGGDHLPARRHMIPVVVLMCALGSSGILWLCRRGAVAATGGVILLLASAGLLLMDGRADPETLRAQQEVWEWRGKAVGRLLQDVFGEQEPLLAVDASGAVPFYSKLPSVDMLGLNDRHIARAEPPGIMEGYVPWHMLGDGDYVMDRQPDLMLFGPPPGLPLPVFSSAKMFEDDPRYLDGYRCVLVETGPVGLKGDSTENLRIPLWVRLEGAVGVQVENDRVVVPGWLLGSYKQPRPLSEPVPQGEPGHEEWKRAIGVATVWFEGTTAVAVQHPETGELVGELRDHLPHRLEALSLPAGSWQVQIAPEGAAVEIRLLDREGEELPKDTEERWEVGGDARVDLECRVPDDVVVPVRIDSVELLRQS